MPDDERIARLQRIAYGADASDEERAAAAAELAALSDPSAPDAADGPDAPQRRTTAGGTPEPVVAGRPAEATRRPDPTHPAAADSILTRSGLRPVLAYAAAALVAGAVIGWALGSATEPSEGVDVGVPVAETAAWEVFERPVTEGDFIRYPAQLVDIDADDTSRRLLLTRSDGVQLVAVRTADGEDACLILALPVGRPATACTEGGRFPNAGLRAEIAVQGVGVYVAGWDAEGNVSINTADAPTG